MGLILSISHTEKTSQESCQDIRSPCGLCKQHSGHFLEGMAGLHAALAKNKMHPTTPHHTHPQISQFSLLTYYVVICNNTHLSKSISKISFLHFKPLLFKVWSVDQHQHQCHWEPVRNAGSWASTRPTQPECTF